VPEWLNGAVSKTVVRASVPRVRIPPPPPLHAGEAPEQGAQLRRLGVVQPGEELRFGLVARADGPAEDRPATPRELDDVAPPVARVGPARHEPLLLQAVEQRDHGRPVDAQVAGRVLLGLRLAAVEEEEDAELAVPDAQRGEALVVEGVERHQRVLEQRDEAPAELRAEVTRIRWHGVEPTATLIVTMTDDQYRRRVLLTGGTGLVGSRLLPRLVDAGHDVRALVRREVALPDGVTAVTGDLADAASLRPAVEGVDAIVHLAAVFRTDDEDAIWRANLEGTRALLDATREHAPGARFVLASTSNVYDADATRPAREEDEATPTAAYPASKLAAERLLRDSGLAWSILRLPFVYGDDDGHLASMPALVDRFGLHPAHAYSVAHHRDVAVMVGLALDGALDGRIVNLTDDAPVTVLEMAELAGDPIDGSAEPLAHPWAGRMDGSLARSLGFRPTVPTIRAAAEAGIL
jgi:UDP-glucose 4-epimerase